MSNIASAVASLQRHTDDKKRMNNHLNLLEATMKVIVLRSLPEFYEYEENIVSGVFSQRSDHEKYFTLLGNPQKGTYLDKLRFCIVWISTDVKMSSERPDVLSKILMVMNEIALSEGKDQAIHQHIFQHLQQVQRLNNSARDGSSTFHPGMSQGGEQKNGVHGSNKTTSSSSSNASWSLSGLTKTVGAVVAKAKEWIPRAAPDTKITQITSNIMSGKDDSSNSSLLYFDPKIGKSVDDRLDDPTYFISKLIFVYYY